VQSASVARNVGSLHLIYLPTGEGVDYDALVDVIPYSRSAKGSSEQELAARPQNPAQFCRVFRPVRGSEVMEAAAIEAGIDRRGLHRSLQQVCTQICGARVADGGGGEGHGREVYARDAPSQSM